MMQLLTSSRLLISLILSTSFSTFCFASELEVELINSKRKSASSSLISATSKSSCLSIPIQTVQSQAQTSTTEAATTSQDPTRAKRSRSRLDKIKSMYAWEGFVYDIEVSYNIISHSLPLLHTQDTYQFVFSHPFIFL